MILSKLVGVNLGYVGYVRYLNNVNPCFQRGRFLQHRSHERLCRRRSPIGWRMWYGPASLPPNIHPMPRFRGYMQTRLCPIMSHHVPSVSGLNEGVWFMYGEEETYVLKLVKCQRIACHAGGPKPSAISCVTQIICWLLFFDIYIYMWFYDNFMWFNRFAVYDVDVSDVSGAKFFESHEVPTEAENLERVRQQHPGIGRGLRIHPPEPRCRKCGKWTPSPQGGAP